MHSHHPGSVLRLGLILLLITVGFDRSLAPADDLVHVDRGDAGMVVSDTAVASRIGRQILLDGGNAVDAAVATAFALAVSWPEAGNIGGGGFMIIRPANGTESVCVDYRETAPLAMHATSFNRNDTTFSQKVVGVPGTVRGMAAAHERYGRLPWSSVVMPAARLAAEGIVVDAPLANSLNPVLQKPEVQQPAFAELRRVYGTRDGSPWKVGERLVLPELSLTLTEIAERGPDAFYTGRIAELLVQEMKRGDGLISLEDLRRYEAKIRPAMRGTYRGYTVLGAPPPSSGGTCVIQALNILENFDLASRDRYDPQNIHLIAETCRRVFADRARFLGDPEFTEIPPHLTTKAYAKELADSIRRDRATPSEEVTPEISLIDESEDTTHFSVVDAEGMAVSNTYTLEASWGSRLVVAGAGFVLNNEMGDFNWFPGETSRKGRIGTAANLVAPGKRMLSSQTPTIVERDGQVVLVTGSPGGRTIINTVLCIVLEFTEFSKDAARAVSIPRMHHQWFPDRLELERLTDPPHAYVAPALRRLGHEVINRPVQGSAHSIAIDSDGTLIGVADYRRGGRPAALQSGRIATWDFDEPAGTTLAAAIAPGSESFIWCGDLAAAETDGLDCILLRNCQSEKSNATLSLPQLPSRVAVELKIHSASLHGTDAGEQLSIELLDQNDDPVVTAIMERQAPNWIVLRGHRNDPETTLKIAEDNRLGATLLRMSIDAEKQTYHVTFRDASSADWRKLHRGSLAEERSVSQLRLTVGGPMCDEGEFIRLDRIDLYEPTAER